MSSFQLEIVTPERIAYNSEVEMVAVPTLSGQIGILNRHMPLFAKLTSGELKIKKDNNEYLLSIGGGYIEISENKVIILVTKASKAEELNEEEILIAKERAKQAILQKVTGEKLITAQSILRQSLVDLKVLQKRKKYLMH